jgi:hypothetical protein
MGAEADEITEIVISYAVFSVGADPSSMASEIVDG